MNKFLVALIVLLLAIGGVFGFLSEREARDMNERLATLQTKFDEVTATAEKMKAAVTKVTQERDNLRSYTTKAEAQVEELKTTLVETEVALTAAKEVATKGNRYSRPGGAIGAAPTETKPMKAMAEMMKSPAMREMIKQQQLAQLDLQYGTLFNRFQLNDEEKANFKQLISERMQAEMDMGLKFMEGNTAKPERDAAVKALSDSKAASDAKIKTFLNNDEDYKTFQDWEDSKPERMQLAMGAANFATAGEPLSPQQEDQLVAAMKQARTSVKDLPDMSKPQNADPMNFTPAMTERLMASYDQQAQQVLGAAAGFLTPKQLEALKALQQQQRAMQEAGLKMSSMMFGNGKK